MTNSEAPVAVPEVERPLYSPEAEHLRGSPLIRVYLREMVGLLKRTIDEIDLAFAALRPVPSDGHLEYIDTAVHDRLRSAVTAAAALRRFIQTPDRGKRESERKYRLREGRAQMLARMLDGLDIAEFLGAGVRNSLEHLEGELDKIAYELADPAVGTKTMILQDLIVSTQARVRPPAGIELRIIRQYVIEEKRYYNIDDSVDVQRLRDQAAIAYSALIARMASLGFKLPTDGYVVGTTIAIRKRKTEA